MVKTALQLQGPWVSGQGIKILHAIPYGTAYIYTYTYVYIYIFHFITCLPNKLIFSLKAGACFTPFLKSLKMCDNDSTQQELKIFLLVDQEIGFVLRRKDFIMYRRAIYH